ncbi:MAG TPA: tetratricopeptide repeat protein [Chloroflexota bacterium]|nr:tetratricopeptide repeat protein [Chloroflexota bacterium]
MSSTGHATPRSAEFARQLRSALVRLYDPVWLQTHPLAAELPEPSPLAPPSQRGEALRRWLLDAIETLRPGAAGPGDARGHKLLRLRYVEALEPAEVWSRLGIAKTQYYRDHNRAVAALVSVLRERRRGPPPGVPAPAEPPTVAQPLSPSPLPCPLSSFVGRERELSALAALLADPDGPRLLTLTGPAGGGKTRLGVEAARAARPAGASALAFADLSPITAPDHVLPTVARALGLRETGRGSTIEQIAAGLHDRPFLLVLDNFEQVLSAAPDLARLLAACPALRAIVTSRAALRVYGEQEFPVPPLALPETSDAPVERLADSEAVRLFVERARAVKPAFALTDDNAVAVAAICRRLDGLPLALELAAARVRLLPPAAMLPRLERALQLLTDGPQDRPVRQRTLRGAIEWSYRLLAPAERELFCRLAVFVGGCTLAAVEDVCGGEDALSTLDALVAQSLVVQSGQADEPRVHLLGTVHEYAAGLLAGSAELGALRRRHATYYLGWAEQAEAELRGGQRRMAWLDRLGRDHDNLRAVLHRAVGSGDAELALRLAGALWRFWWVRGYAVEGREHLADVLGMPGVDAHPAALAKALNGAGALAGELGDAAAARLHFERSLALRRALGDDDGVAATLVNLALIALHAADTGAARRYLEEGLAIVRRQGDARGIARSLSQLANVEMLAGDHAAATELLSESLAAFRSIGDEWAVSNDLLTLGYVALAQGDHAGARALFQESLPIFRKVDYRLGLVLLLAGFAAVAGATGQPRRAARLAAAAAAQAESRGLTIQRPERDIVQPYLARVYETLDQPAVAAAATAGRALSLDAAIADALQAAETAWSDTDREPPRRHQTASRAGNHAG